jgi:hypothetical protein
MKAAHYYYDAVSRAWQMKVALNTGSIDNEPLMVDILPRTSLALRLASISLDSMHLCA